MDTWITRLAAKTLDEQKVLFHQAAFSQNHARLQAEQDSFWLPYKDDVERIIHSKAFKRYSDKTQVVYLVENDHLTHRGVHVQLVSSYARSICSFLGLNGDLVEAIALGHDVGHPPFGHEGEGYLSELCQEIGIGCFSHSRQSCRLLSLIEPLNLGFAVYDGFLCHDGGMKNPRSVPLRTKNWEVHFEELESRKQFPEKDLQPATLEGCLVKMCDSVSYLAKDIEDAIQLGIIRRDEVPKTCLGITNKAILQAAARDLVAQSAGQEYIGFSDEVFAALKHLRKFNFERIYTFAALKVESRKIKNGYRQLFELLQADFKKTKEVSHLYKNFLHSKSASYIEQTVDEQKIVDYIAGMTDRYFVSTLEDFVIPQTITLDYVRHH